MESRESTIPRERKMTTGRVRPRARLEVEVSLTSESQFYADIAGSVVEGGLFLATYQRRRVGTRLDIELSLPSGTVDVRGTVRWVREGREGVPPGVGIAFDELSETTRRAIDDFCTERAPLYYDVES